MLRNGSVNEVTSVCACECVRIDGKECDSSHIAVREIKKDGERIRGRSVAAPSSSQVNIDTALADTAPAVLINHLHWTYIYISRHAHRPSQREGPTRIAKQYKYMEKNTHLLSVRSARDMNCLENIITLMSNLCCFVQTTLLLLFKSSSSINTTTTTTHFGNFTKQTVAQQI